MSFFSHFHFLRPEYLWLIPAILLIWVLAQRFSRSSQWQDHLPIAVVQALQVTRSRSSKYMTWVCLIVWWVMSLAAAGPSWLKQAVPVVENQHATVIILDLSPSMLAKDLSPNRLTLAKYKLIDALRIGNQKHDAPSNANGSSSTPEETSDERLALDGQFALIAYAGDAHTVSPLTDDPKTIEALLPALHPNILPSSGSNIEAAVEQANRLLVDAGVLSGHLLLITDGVPSSAFKSIEKTIAKRHTLSILGIGSADAAPVPMPGGGFMRKSNGEIVLAALNNNELQSLAQRLGGRFAQISTDESDLAFLMNKRFLSGGNNADLSDNSNAFDTWIDMGHWLLLLAIPLFLLFFRKGLIYSLVFINLGLFIHPTDSFASESSNDSLWSRMWNTPDQRGAKMLKQEQYAKAADTFKNKHWSAVAAYKNADYAKTIEQLEGKTDHISRYNRANALAMNGQIDDAIKTYKSVLAQNPKHADAQHNLNVLEALKSQQQQQQNEEGQENSDSESQQGQPQESQDSASSNSDQADSDQADSKPDSKEQSNSQEGNSAQEAPDAENEGEHGQPTDENQAQDSRSENNSTDPSDESENPTSANQVEKTESESENESENESEQSTQVLVNPDTLKDSSEQWLRAIEDDPSGLLRRKFEFQSRQRQQLGQPRKQQNSADQQRY